jgi:ABC-2 type transport system permease protein
MPEIDDQGVTSFRREGPLGSHLLGVINEGEFTSYFAGKKSPLSTEETGSETSSVIEKSPASAQIILFSSNDFLRDQTLTIANSAVGSEYRGSLELIANAVDWALEDDGLLSIRSRGHFNRTLPPMEHDAQLFWEYLNYGLIIAALIIIALVRRIRQKSRQQRYLTQLAN